MYLSVLAVSLGASLGALLRWQLGMWLNALASSIPIGTLTANLVGGYLIGVFIALFAHYPSVPAEWRLLVITGFLGGLTTFSTFSAEIVDSILKGDLRMALIGIAVHVVGSLMLTALGIVTVTGLRDIAARA